MKVLCSLRFVDGSGVESEPKPVSVQFEPAHTLNDVVMSALRIIRRAPENVKILEVRTMVANGELSEVHGLSEKPVDRKMYEVVLQSSSSNAAPRTDSVANPAKGARKRDTQKSQWLFALAQASVTIQSTILGSLQRHGAATDALAGYKANLKTSVLGRYRIVCASPMCTEGVVGSEGTLQTIYTTHCHSDCKEVDGDDTGRFVNPALLKCSKLSTGTCTFCGCDWDLHLRVTKEHAVDYSVGDVSQTGTETPSTDMLEQLYAEQRSILEAAAHLTTSLFISHGQDSDAADFVDHLLRAAENQACLRESIQALIRRYNEELAATVECVQQGVLEVTEQSAASAFDRVTQLAVSGPNIRSLLQSDIDPARRSKKSAGRDPHELAKRMQQSEALNKVLLVAVLALIIILFV